MTLPDERLPYLGPYSPPAHQPEASLEELLQASFLSQGKGLPGDVRARRANALCPFSHEPLESSSAVELRCGHRIALATLHLARHAALHCAAAGHIRQECWVCPLCGDQYVEERSDAGAGFLTTYSSSADAYMGQLRKDWQMPLRLPPSAVPEEGD